MNYSDHYDRLIIRGQNRTPQDGYFEKHHVVPRCLGGDDSEINLVLLTAEEHFVAHQLLVKLHPANTSLIYAAKQMTISGRGQQRANNKLYGWLRRKHIEAHTERIRGNSYAKGNKLSDATRKRMSESHKGKKHSEAIKEKIRNTNVATKAERPAKPISEETRAKLRAASAKSTRMSGRKMSPETRAKMSAAQYARQERERTTRLSVIP